MGTQWKSRIAIVGFGRWGARYWDPLVDAGASVVIVDPEARPAHDDHRPHFESLSDLLNSSVTVEGAIVATPAFTHFAVASQLLSAGIGVLVEKPFSTSLFEAKTLYSLAEQNHVSVASGHLLLHHPGICSLWEDIRDGVLGELVTLHAVRTALGRIRSDEDVLWSFGPHDIATILAMRQQVPARVEAHCMFLRESEQADVVSITLTYASGQRDAVFLSWVGPVRQRHLMAFGSRATSMFDELSEPHLTSTLLESICNEEVTERPRSENFHSKSLLAEQVQWFIETVSKRTVAKSDRQLALTVSCILELADLSCRRNTVVDVAPIYDIDGSPVTPSIFSPPSFARQTGNES